MHTGYQDIKGTISISAGYQAFCNIICPPPLNLHVLRSKESKKVIFKRCRIYSVVCVPHYWKITGDENTAGLYLSLPLSALQLIANYR